MQRLSSCRVAIKGTQDSICTALGINDKTIDYIEAIRMPLNKTDPHCEVEVFIQEGDR